MGLGVGGVEQECAGRTARAGERLEHLAPYASLGPAHETVVQGLPRSILGWRSAHRPPERSTCTMPEITRRSSTRGTPRVSRGSKGARRANCSSVSQNRSDMLKLLTRRSLNPLTTNPVPIYGSEA